MSKTYIIYGYYQPAENKWYVGRTGSYPFVRAGKEGERYLLKCPKFAEAIRKYGWDSFEYHVLETTEDEKLSWELEKKWIALKDSYNNGYNLTLGGKGAYGHKSASGIHWTQERRNKTREVGLKNRNRPDQSKKVRQYSKDGTFIAEYPSLAEAERQTGVSQCGIYSANKRGGTSGGFRWEYI